MTWTAPYQRKRDQYWPEVEQFFSQLPPQLFQQGVLLKNNLATFYADTGQFKDILCRERDHPLLYWHLWLLDDWDCPATAARAEFEQRLLVAMTLAFAAAYCQESILDQGSNFDNRYLFLSQVLLQQADLHLAQLFPGPSPFWTYHQSFWQEYAETMLPSTDRRRLITDLQTLTANPRPLTGKLAYTKLSAVAACLHAKRENLWPQLCPMLDQLNGVFQILQDISTIRRDIGQRQLTYPILRTMQEAGLDPLQPTSLERLLGALVLTGTMQKIGQECLSQLKACQTISDSLELPSFTAYLVRMVEWVEELSELFSFKPKAQDRPVKVPRSPFFRPYVDTLPKVIEMAEGYLLSDLTFRESWEVQRRGVFGVDEMTGKAFPMGLIAELLNRHGHDMTGPINEIFATLQATGFRYYDHPHLPPDADDLGLLLRLYPYSAQPDQHRELLQTPLHWLKTGLSESGEIPVWLMDGAANREDYPHLSLWGHNCATVEANVLLGLIAYDGAGYADLIVNSVRSWGQRWLTKGLAATLHYVPLYSVWTGLELIARLKSVILSEVKSSQNGEDDSISRDLQPQLDLVAQTLTRQLAQETKRSSLTPQDAAFLILTHLLVENQKTSRISETLEVYLSDWVNYLGKSQRYDGSWAAESLYGTPTRGELASWYSSRTVTTAFCYHALKTYQKDKIG